MKNKKGKLLFRPQTIFALVVVGAIAGFYISQHIRDVYSTAQVPILVNDSSQDFLNIPSLQIKAPIFYSNDQDTRIAASELDLGVVHVKNTPVPGEVGNAYFVGGSDLQKHSKAAYNDIFKDLEKINTGDQIIITKNLKHLVYQVYETRIVEPTELWVTSQITDGQQVLTLQADIQSSKTHQKFIVIARMKK